MIYLKNKLTQPGQKNLTNRANPRR